MTILRYGTFALTALAAFAFAASPAPAQEDPHAAHHAASGYDLEQLSPDVRAAVEAARAAEAEAQDAAARAQGAARNGERARGNTVINGNGYFELNGGATYAGAVSNSVFQGYGIYTFAEGATLKYEGQLNGGAMHGYGIYHWRNGGRYAGARVEGMRAGAGVHHFPDGRRFEGAWADDMRNGFGVEWGADGRIRGAGFWADNQLAAPMPR